MWQAQGWQAPTPIDVQALNDVRKGPNSKKFYALRHKATGLFFHRSAARYGNMFYTATWPMARQKGVWTNWMKEFQNPQDWELIPVPDIECE